MFLSSFATFSGGSDLTEPQSTSMTPGSSEPASCLGSPHSLQSALKPKFLKPHWQSQLCFLLSFLLSFLASCALPGCTAGFPCWLRAALTIAFKVFSMPAGQAFPLRGATSFGRLSLAPPEPRSPPFCQELYSYLPPQAEPPRPLP